MVEEGQRVCEIRLKTAENSCKRRSYTSWLGQRPPWRYVDDISVGYVQERGRYIHMKYSCGGETTTGVRIFFTVG